MQELIVKQKAEELLYRVYPRLVNFPKAEKFALCARIKEAFFDVIKFIYLGNSVKSKRKVYLQEADGHARYANAFRFIRKLEDKFGFLCYRRNKLHVNL
jgi:hypothetical protein